VVECEETPDVVLEAAFTGGFVDGCGGRALAFVVVEAAGTVVDEGLPSGAVESIVVC
jgi:hypothetical protein